MKKRFLTALLAMTTAAALMAGCGSKQETPAPAEGDVQTETPEKEAPHMPEKCTDSLRDCPLAARLEALERANAQHAGTHRDVFDRLRELERLEGIQGEQYKNILEKLDGLARRHDELTQKLSDLEAKPGRRWDALVEKGLWAVCAAVIAFFLGRVGL